MSKIRVALVGLLCLASCGESQPNQPAGDDDDDDASPPTSEIEAPEELDELAAYLFAHFDEPAYLAAGVAEMRGQLGGTGDWVLDPLDVASVGAVDHPDGNLADLLGVMVARPTSFAPTQHVQHVVEHDQTVVFDGYVRFDRVVVDGDTEELLGGQGRVTFADDVVASSFVLEIPYLMDTVAVWVDDVLVVRRSLPTPGCTEDGDSCLSQSFGVDVYAPQGRLAASWSESDAPVEVPDDVVLDALTSGLEERLEDEEAWLE